MLAATIVLVCVTGAGVIATLLKAIHSHGQKSGELASALSDNTKATEHLTSTVEKMDATIQDHEIRIIRLESVK